MSARSWDWKTQLKQPAFWITFCLIVYLLVLGFIYIVQWPVMDEYWFWEIALQKMQTFSWASIFTQDNQLSYGAGYWIIHTAFDRLTTGHGIIPFRVLSYFGYASIALTLWLAWRKAEGIHKFPAALGFLLWLAFYAAYWMGKLTGPDPLAMGLAAWGLYCLLTKNTLRSGWIGWLFIGAGIGIKLNTLPVAWFAAWLAQSRCKTMKGWQVVGLVSGFILMNPFTLLNPGLYFWNFRVQNLSHTFEPLLSRLDRVLYHPYWTWDGIQDGGLLFYSFSFLIILPFIVLFIKGLPERRMQVALWGTLLIALAIQFKSGGGYYGWYWLPTLPCFCWAMTQISFKRLPAWAPMLTVLLVLMNAGLQFPTLYSAIKNIEAQRALISQQPFIQTCLNQKLNQYQAQVEGMTRIVDFTEYVRDPNFLTYSSHSPHVLRLLDSFLWLSSFNPHSEMTAQNLSWHFKPPQGNTLVVLSERLGRIFQFYPFTAYASHAKSYSTPEALFQCGSIHVYRLLAHDSQNLRGSK